jgi:hypothetical protein
MNVLILPLSDVSDENIYLLDSKKNILMDGMFTKLSFMNEWFTINGIYLYFPIVVQNVKINPMMGQKHTIYFSVNEHIDLIHKIEVLEQSILSKYYPSDNTKSPIYSLNNSLQMGFFKIYKETKFLQKNAEFVLKISGIWENAKNFGLSYKIMDSVSID